MPAIAVATHNDAWEKEGYEWDVDSEVFRIANWMVMTQAFKNPGGDIRDFSPDFTNERKQFDKIYWWVVENLLFEQLAITMTGKPIDDNNEINTTFHIKNGGSTPVHVEFQSSQQHATEKTVTWSLEEDLSIGVKKKTTIPFLGKLEISIDAAIKNTNTQSTTTSDTIAFSTDASWDIPPMKVSECVLTVLNRKIKGQFTLHMVGDFAEGSQPPVLEMNYGKRTVQPDNVPNQVLTVDRHGNLDAAFDVSMSINRGPDLPLSQFDSKKSLAYAKFASNLTPRP